MSGTKTGAYVDNTGTIDNDGLRRAEDQIDIVARKNQTDANSEIYYIMYLNKNRTLTTLDKINKISIS